MAASPGFVGRLFGSIDPAERLGELLFGLIMVLTFTLGASLQLGGDRDATRELLIAALGCNTAWGVIDAALYLMNRLSERGRLHRLVRAIQGGAGDESALAMVARELDDRIPGMVGPELRAALAGEVLARLRATDLGRTRIGAADLLAAFVVFLLVFLTALPAVIPFFVLHDPQIAIRLECDPDQPAVPGRLALGGAHRSEPLAHGPVHDAARCCARRGRDRARWVIASRPTFGTR
jgi:hypothetical protein